MRRLFIFFLLTVSAFIAWGAPQCDSIRVYFALNKATMGSALNNDSISMAKFIDSIVAAANSGNLDSVAVYGYASPEGSFRNNNKLSGQRCAVVADYISRQAGIPLTYIYASPEGAAWEGLRALVIKNTLTPSRDAVLRVLDRYLPDACTEMSISAKCIKSLKAIDGGRTYDWMFENLFPELRCALAVYAYSTPADSSATAHPVSENVEPAPEAVAAEAEPADSIPSVSSPSGEAWQIEPGGTLPHHRFALKTNMLYYAALMPNLEFEWLINDRWSVALEGNVAWWGSYEKERSYRVAVIDAEARHWILPRAPWHGMYVGLMAGGGWYDIEKGSPGKYGDGLMAGLSAGYMWPIGRNFSLDAEIGAGYAYTRYKEYEPRDGHHLYMRTKDVKYFGPIKAKLSIVWRFFDTNKPKRIKSSSL